MSDIEEFLFKNGYWKLSIDKESDGKLIILSAKFHRLTDYLYEMSPTIVFTEELIWKYLLS